MKALEGIIPVLITPLNKKLDLDIQSLKKIINYISFYNPCAFWANGTGSEDMSLSLNKRITLTKKICDFNKKKIPIISGCSFHSFD